MSANDVANAPDANKFPILVTKADTKDKTYIVTGSNQGLGLEAARHLVSLGASKVVLTARDLQAGDEAVKDIETTTGIKGVAEVWNLDLADYESVKIFAKKANGLERVDGVIQNAGIALDTWGIAEGHERNVTVNTYSTLLLGILLLPKLKETGKKFGTLPYLVNVGTSYSFLNEKDLKQLHESGLKGLDVEANAVMEDR
jgi:NAD(P)-dependent dehydrogenase (short-subunit alcohol dehydrogenase family)